MACFIMAANGSPTPPATSPYSSAAPAMAWAMHGIQRTRFARVGQPAGQEQEGRCHERLFANEVGQAMSADDGLFFLWRADDLRDGGREVMHVVHECASCAGQTVASPGSVGCRTVVASASSATTPWPAGSTRNGLISRLSMWRRLAYA
ncbi:Uncharacterised protein [Bordetella pertussis]|nr:Uncharacterised protein [Bordetella pertussis]